MTKRSFLKTASLLSVASIPNIAFAKDSAKKVVIAGGGFAGLTVAKYLKIFNKNLDVTVIDRAQTLTSCPFSNIWLADLIDKKSLELNRKKAAKKNGYNLKIAEITAINSDSVVTTAGNVPYDYLILAGGISYDYESMFGTNQALIDELKTKYPAGLISASERDILKNGIKDLKNGTFVMNVPSGAYRCPPGPYERACMIAYYFKSKNYKSKVVLVDSRVQPASKPSGFLSVFKELYGDYLEYVPSTTIKNVDTNTKEVLLESFNKDSATYENRKINFDFLSVLPPNKANSVVTMAGIETTKEGWAKLKMPTFESINKENVYVIGDSTAYPFPKSAQMANSMAIICAKQIALKSLGSKEVFDELPANICYSFVNGKPEEAIVVSHSTNFVDNSIKVTPAEITIREEFLASSAREWFKALMSDIS